MKHAKKLVSLLLAVVMTMALGISGFATNLADDQTTGTITIKNASKGETYSIYKIFDAEVNAQNTEAVRYKVPEGSNFTSNTYFTVDENKYVTITEAGKSAAGGLSEGAVNFLKDYVKNNNLEPTKTAEASGSALEFTEVPFGYYYISSTQGAAVTVSTNNPNATVNDKNTTEPGWHPDPDPEYPDDPNKKVVGKTIYVNGKNYESKDFNIGDTVTFQIKIDTANYDGEKQITSYTIGDQFPGGLRFEGIESVTVGNQTLDPNTDYLRTNNGFPIKVLWVDENGNSKYANKAVLTVTYTATVTEDAVIDGDGNENTATFVYNTDEENPGGTEPVDPDPEDPQTNKDKATVYTYALALVKVDEKGNYLKGAEFKLPFFVLKESDGNYVVCAKDTDNATDTVVTPADGKVLIRGVDLKSYNITEEKAPAGYNKVDGTIPVQAVKYSKTETNTFTYIDSDGKTTETETNVKVEYVNNDVSATAVFVVNKSGATLPSTGGMGTKMLYIVGAILVLGAGLTLIVRKRMNGQNA